MTDDKKKAEAYREAAGLIRTWSPFVADCLIGLADKVDPPKPDFLGREAREGDEGRLVMVRDNDDDEWEGPVIMKYRREHPAFWDQSRFYHGTHVLNMIPWHGGECPMDEEQTVVVRRRDGWVRAGKAYTFPWPHRNMQDDIIEWSLVDLRSEA